MKEKKIAEPDYDFRMEDITGENVSDKIYFGEDVLFVKCMSGSATVLINSSEQHITSGMNFMLAEHALFKMQEYSNDLHIRTLHFSMNFFNGIYPLLAGEVIDVMDIATPDMYSTQAGEMLDLIFRQLCLLYDKKDHAYRHTLVTNLVVNYLLTIYEQAYRVIKNKTTLYPSDRTTQITYRFYELCYEDALYHRDIKYYADKLNITSRYLYKICKETTGLTPKQAIDYVIAGKVKKLLLTTEMTNQQISNELLFPDQATFGQYFKRNVGMSPSEFRRKYK